MSESLLATIIVGVSVVVVDIGSYAGYQYKANSDRADTAQANVALRTTVIQVMQGQDKAFNG